MPSIFINYSTLNSQHKWGGESIEDGQQENQLENTCGHYRGFKISKTNLTP